jgi:hypothetical protein
MLSVVILNVVMLNAFMLIVTAPDGRLVQETEERGEKKLFFVKILTKMCVCVFTSILRNSGNLKFALSFLFPSFQIYQK